ncbi:MAG: hypothetical protein H6559_24890 [Lewinellaceae bacterium]|nr:hypothetical protein [Lewinellaceae bacterium]
MEADQIKSIACSNCGFSNSPLRTHCKTCGIRLVELRASRQRVGQLEQAALQFYQQQSYYDAIRAYAVLLEYKPGLPKFLKGLCKSLIALKAKKEAGEVLAELKQKKKNDPELVAIENQLEGLQED